MMRARTFGFIGTGTITEAIVTGLMKSPLPINRIRVSPRNADIARRLANRFDSVVVAADNQAVVDGCDVIFLAVRQQVAEEVLSGLKVDPSQTIISLIAATEASTIAAWMPGATTVIRAIPLPFVADLEGVTAVFPSNPTACDVFDALGNAVTCETREAFDLLATASSVMGAYYGLQERMVEWLVGKGLSGETAGNYLQPLFASLAHAAVKAGKPDYARLRHEYSTAGGLNEQVFRVFEQQGGTEALTAALDSVLQRVRTGSRGA